jgi:hypothetical protein
MAMALEMRTARCALWMKMNGTTTGSVEREDEEEDADRTAPVLAREAWTLGRWQLLEMCLDSLEIGGL